MKKVLSIIICLIMALSVGAVAYADEVNFTDVNPGSWYYNDVMNAVELGIINGKTTTKFAPDDNLTYAEAIKIAACMYQVYKEGEVLLVSDGKPWYQTYVDYAKEHGIISKDYNYNEKATRAGYMEIFANALPDEALEEINYVPHGSIPDVPVYEEYCDEIYKLYRAGILQGVDSSRRCEPSANIKRCEVAAIITRMMDKSKRLKFDMPGYEKVPEYQEEDVVTDTETKIPVKEEDVVVTPSVEYDPGNTEDYQDYTPLPLEIKMQPESIEVSGYGAPGSLIVEANGGNGVYTYQWKYREGRETYDVTDSISVNGATTNKLTIYTNPNEKLMGKSIYCTVTDANGKSVNSSAASVFGPFIMVADDYSIQGTDKTLLTGRLTDGLLKKGDKLSVERNGKIIAFGTVADIQMFNKSLDEAQKGDSIGLVFELTDGVRPGSGDTVMRYQDFHELDLSDIIN